METSDVIKKVDALDTQRSSVENTWSIIERFVAPFRGKFFEQSPGEGGIEWQRRDIYDATAVMAHQSLASSLHGSLTNPAIRWFEMQWRDSKLRKDHAAQVWLEDAARKTFDALQDSNFNLEINETYRDLTSFGTSALLQEPLSEPNEDWEGIEFTSVPLKEVFFEPDRKGGVRTFFRRMQWRASKVIDKFGADNPRLPEKVKTLYEKASDEQIEIIFAVYPNPDHNPRNKSRLLVPQMRPWRWCYVMRSGEDGPVELKSGGYYEMPAYVPRWLTTSESVWGNSPATVALADILTLNQLIHLQLKALEKAVDPPILAQERALLADLDLGPAALNVVRDVSQVIPFESRARFDMSQMKVEDLRQAITRYFFIDQLELKESPAMTATEVQVRYELMQRLLAATLSRLRHDMLDPLVQRTFNLLFRGGRFMDLPESLRQTAPDFDVEYIGPLSRSQRFDQSASVERWMTQLNMISNTSPEAEEVMMVPNWPELARYAARNLNLPTNLTRPDREVKQAIEGRRQGQARATSASSARDEAAAARDISQAEQLRTTQNPDITGGAM